ncbi:UNVERIFIED_CONTAM: hypothetical protein K2H54_049967 [Gekko kuhli]
MVTNAYCRRRIYGAEPCSYGKIWKNSGHESLLEASRKDVKEWPEVSTSYLQTKGLRTSKLNVEEWPHVSMSSIQERRYPDPSKRNLVMGEHKGSTIDVRPSSERMNLLEPRADMCNSNVHELYQPRADMCNRNVHELYQPRADMCNRNVHELYQPKLIEESSAKSKQNVGKQLHLSSSGEVAQRSMLELQHPVSKQNLQLGGHGGSTIDVRASLERTNLLEPRADMCNRIVHELYQPKLIEESSAKSKQNMGKQLHLSPSVNSWEVAQRSMLELQHPVSKQNLQLGGHGGSTIDVRPSLERTNLLELSADISSRNVNSGEVVPSSMLACHSESGMNNEHLETPSQLTAERLVRFIRDLQTESPRSSTQCMRSRGPASTQKVTDRASTQRVKEWLEASMRSPAVEGTEASKLSLQQWLEDSMRTLDVSCPAKSRYDVQKWLQASLRKLQELNALEHSAGEWIGASLRSLKEEVPQWAVVEDHLQEEAPLQKWLQGSLKKLQVEDSKTSKDNVKEWLESSLREFTGVGLEQPGHDVKKWLKRALRNLHAPKQNLQQYIEESLECLRAGSLAASASRHNMDWLNVSQGTMETRDSREILRHGSSGAHFDRDDVSRMSLIPEENEGSPQQEAAGEISQIFITPEVQPKTLKQRGAKIPSNVDSCKAAPRIMLSGSEMNYETERSETPSQPTAESYGPMWTVVK